MMDELPIPDWLATVPRYDIAAEEGCRNGDWVRLADVVGAAPDSQRLVDQAHAIGRLLEEAGVGACPLTEGVRLLVHRAEARSAAVQIGRAERADAILKQLQDIQYEVQQAEDAWGRIVPPEHWRQLFDNIRRHFTNDDEGLWRRNCAQFGKWLQEAEAERDALRAAVAAFDAARHGMRYSRLAEAVLDAARALAAKEPS